LFANPIRASSLNRLHKQAGQTTAPDQRPVHHFMLATREPSTEEMLAECQNQTLLKSLIGSSTSCGRYARSGFKQCGRCVPCLVRRSAFHKWLGHDLTAGYKFSALGTPDKKHRDFDDVRSVAYAIHAVKQRGLDAWIGGALNSAMPGASPDARGVADRGLKELSEFLKSQGVL
jgi:hypothetical protein